LGTGGIVARLVASTAETLMDLLDLNYCGSQMAPARGDGSDGLALPVMRRVRRPCSGGTASRPAAPWLQATLAGMSRNSGPRPTNRPAFLWTASVPSATQVAIDSQAQAHRTTGTPRAKKTPGFSARGLAVTLGTATSVEEVALDAEHRGERILVLDGVEAARSA
jgi:hypothetical protein